MATQFSNIADMKRQSVGGFPQPVQAQMESDMPNKAVSKSQFKFFQGVKHGSIKAKGMSAEKAGEMLGSQNSKGLPNKVRRHKVRFPKPDRKG